MDEFKNNYSHAKINTHFMILFTYIVQIQMYSDRKQTSNHWGQRCIERKGLQRSTRNFADDQHVCYPYW